MDPERNIKLTISENIGKLRQAAGMTQLDLAGALNYSDKTVSKWERGEALPDVIVLYNIAEMFGVTLDYLTTEHEEVAPVGLDEQKKRWVNTRALVTGISLMAVWLIATLVFVIIRTAREDLQGSWMAFVCAIPVTMVVWLVLNTIWFSRRRNYVIISLLMWTTLLTFFALFFEFGFNIWRVFWLGIPGQAIILFWSFLGKVRATGPKERHPFIKKYH